MRGKFKGRDAIAKDFKRNLIEYFATAAAKHIRLYRICLPTQTQTDARAQLREGGGGQRGTKGNE